MAAPSIPVTSPDISALSFSILYDISGAMPTATLTNLSTVIHANNLTWWYVLSMPSGTPIHTGSLSTPDVAHAPWTTLQLPANQWMLMFGNPPCAQIEFSNAAPYVCTLYVQDSASNVFSLTINQAITRPNGNTQSSCGNFGMAVVGVEVKCQNNPIVVFCADSTNTAYQSVLTPTSQSDNWILTYPPDVNGNVPANGTASNTPYVNFNAGYSSEGYVIFRNLYATYDMGNGASVKLQYKAINPKTGTPGISFAVLCNIDLCRLNCQIQAFLDVSKKQCGLVENTTYDSKKANISILLSQAMLGIQQPLCQIDVNSKITEIQAIIGNLGNNCDCGCTDTGINFNYPTSTSPSSSGCCPVSVSVLDSVTGMPPASCPNSYFPCQVKDPTNTTIIDTAVDMNNLVAILNSYPAWQAYGIAFAEGNCKVGWFPTNPATTPPPIIIVAGGSVIPPTKYTDNIIDKNTGVAPVGCPSGNPYPFKVYDPTATSVIGIVNTPAELASLLNATPAWAAYGVASVQDSCHIQFNLTNASSLPPVIKVDPNVASTTCVSDTANYVIPIVDPCFTTGGTITSAYFPCNVFVDWITWSGPVALGIVNSFAEIVTGLNGAVGKPSQLTFSLGSVPDTIEILNSDCAGYPHVPNIYSNGKSNSVLLWGGNYSNQRGVLSFYNGEFVLGVADNSSDGRVAGATPNKHVWHTIQIDKYAITAEGDTGKVFFYDISNPLSPSLVKIIQLNDTGSGTCFTGVPEVPSYVTGAPIHYYFSLYFPTDLNAINSSIDLHSIPICEGITGSLWILNFFDTGSGIVASIADQRLLGKVPRFVSNFGSSIIFTQDGDLEQAAGLVSGVPAGYIVTAIFTAPSTFNFSETQIFPSGELVWGASYNVNTSQTFWTGNKGTIGAGFTTGSLSVINTHVFGSTAEYLNRINTVIMNGSLYIAAINLTTDLGSPPILVSYNPLKIVTLASILAAAPVVSQIQTVTAPGFSSAWNFMPLNGCLFAVVLSEKGCLAGLINNPAGHQVVEIYSFITGYVGSITATTSSSAANSGYMAFNYIALTGYGVYTPNTYTLP